MTARARRRTLVVGATLLLAAFAGVAWIAARGDAHGDWGPAVGGVQAALVARPRVAMPGEQVQLYVRFRNVGSAQVSLDTYLYATLNLARNGVAYADAIGNHQLAPGPILLDPGQTREFPLARLSRRKQPGGVFTASGGVGAYPVEVVRVFAWGLRH